MTHQVVAAELTWTGARFERSRQVVVDETGRIAALGALGLSPTVRLEHCALLPGMVNAHSHAFQRGLRGRGESFPTGAGSFWSWREAMYELAAELSVESVRELSRQAFSEMRRAGITTVGEFHYLHHRQGHDFAFDRAVIEAAAEADIRLVLLQAYYRTGGIGKPLAPRQLHFETPDLSSYFDQLEHLGERLDPGRASLGVVAHSLRAANPEEVQLLYHEACRRKLPFHLHVEEQRQEIADSLAAYGAGPLALLNRSLAISGTVTAVHCTHSRPEDLAPYLAAGGRICLCPTTEANLGDGIPDLPAMAPWRHQLCLGTDSNARISMLEEMRWLEYGQRLARERRGVLLDEAGEVARPLWASATVNGAGSLAVAAGALESGCWADFLAVDLEAPSLAGATEDSLAGALALGCSEEVVLA
nr:formimidoylglutamate deiminase [Thermoanaerobaculia bacterium]